MGIRLWNHAFPETIRFAAPFLRYLRFLLFKSE